MWLKCKLSALPQELLQKYWINNFGITVIFYLHLQMSSFILYIKIVFTWMKIQMLCFSAELLCPELSVTSFNSFCKPSIFSPFRPFKNVPNYWFGHSYLVSYPFDRFKTSSAIEINSKSLTWLIYHEIISEQAPPGTD